MLEELWTPSRVGTTKVGGIDLNKPRMRWVVEAVIALCLSLSPHGFTASELARQVRVLSNQGESEYGLELAQGGFRGQAQIWVSSPIQSVTRSERT